MKKKKARLPIYEIHPMGSYGDMVARREQVLTGRKAEPGVCIVERFEKGEKNGS